MSPRAVDVLLVALLAALLALGVAVCPLDDRGDRVAQLSPAAATETGRMG